MKRIEGWINKFRDKVWTTIGITTILVLAVSLVLIITGRLRPSPVFDNSKLSREFD